MATDISSEIIAEANKIIPEIPKMVCSAYDLPFNDSSWDVVLACEVMEHVEEPQKLIIEANRIAAKYCIFTVPLEPWWRVANVLRGKYLTKFGNTPGHIQHWNKNSLLKEMEGNFEEFSYKRVGLWQMIVAVKH